MEEGEGMNPWIVTALVIGLIVVFWVSGAVRKVGRYLEDYIYGDW